MDARDVITKNMTVGELKKRSKEDKERDKKRGEMSGKFISWLKNKNIDKNDFLQMSRSKQSWYINNFEADKIYRSRKKSLK